jgi:protein gp37
MGDLFHELVPDDFIVKVFDVMRLNDRHRFQVLTKRVVRMFHWVMGYERTEGAPFAIQAPNVWLGTSVENQRAADERIPHLLQTPAAKRFVSAEPLLGPIEFDAPGRPWLTTEIDHEEDTRLDQIIVGGESGTKARPMHRDWVRSIRDQCLVTGTPFFFKQWGEWAPAGSRGEYCCNPGASIHDLETMNRVGKKAAGRELDGREWNEAPK